MENIKVTNHQLSEQFTFSRYQKQSRETAQYPNPGSNYIYPALGLGNEAGEVLGKIKKLQRDKNNVVDDTFREAIGAEIGDVLWYLAQLATEFNLNFGDIAFDNLVKLFDRQKRNVIKGDGDNR